jgi:virulence factor Mce-like protein
VGTLVAVAVLCVAGLAYLLLAVARLNPFEQPMRMTVDLGRSGGLLSTSPVTYRGYQVGKVEDIALRPGGVRVTVSIEEGTQIPADTEVAVGDLSAAGEQYLDFRPRTDGGPFLADGAVIHPADTRTPVPFAQLVGNLTGMIEQVDPDKLNIAVHEARLAFDGSAPDMQQILDGGLYVLNGLTSVLPETINTLRNGQTTLGTVADLRGQIAQFGGSARGLTGRLRGADGTIRTVLEDSPGTLDLVHHVIKENGSAAGSFLGNLVSVTDVVDDRLPAISQFLPNLSKIGPTASGFITNSSINALADLYPRPTCDYGTPRRLPQLAGSPSPRIYRYCTQTGPRLQQRGANNVPRPSGDDTAGPPRGAHPEDRAGPLPNSNGGR